MTHSTHPIEREEVMAYLDGELTPKHAAFVAAHLEECGECRILAEELRGVSRQLLPWDVEPAPKGLAEPADTSSTLRELSEAKSPSPPAVTRGTRRVWFAIQPKILAFAGLGVVVVSLIAWLALPNTFRQVKFQTPVVSEEPKAQARTAVTNGLTAHQTDAYLVAQEQEAISSQQMSGPMIVRTAELTLVTKEIDSARNAIEHIVAQNKGYIAKLEIHGKTGSGRTLITTLRVPANQLDEAMAQLKKLGEVVRESQKGEEVGFQYADLQARLANAHRTESRLIELLTQRTGKLSDVLDVEKELDSTRGEIERMDAQRRRMEAQVQFAAVEVSLREEYNAKINLAPPSTDTRLRNAIVEGWQTVVEGVLTTAVFVLHYLPSALFWILILFWPARRFWRSLSIVTNKLGLSAGTS